MTKPRPAPVLVVANPKSGGGLAGELVPYLARDLAARGYAVDVFQSAAAGEITERVRGLRSGWSALAIVGGDGTVREVLRAQPPPDLKIAVLPSGTANVLATEYRLPKAPRDTAAMIAAGNARVLDTGIAERAGAPEERFALFVGAGADARIVQRVHEKRAGGTLGKLRYVAPIVGALWSYQPVKHWMVLEDGSRLGPFEQVLVTNVASYGGMWKLPGNIRADDGLFDCLGFRAATAGQLLRHGVLGTLNKLREGDDLVHVQAARVRVEADAERSPVQVDGDPGGYCPLEIRVIPASLTLLVP